MNCLNCGGDVYRISGLHTDYDGIREDAYCPDCHIRFGVRSHGLVVITEPTKVESPDLVEMNKTLKALTEICKHTASMDEQIVSALGVMTDALIGDKNK